MYLPLCMELCYLHLPLQLHLQLQLTKFIIAVGASGLNISLWQTCLSVYKMYNNKTAQLEILEMDAFTFLSLQFIVLFLLYRLNKPVDGRILNEPHNIGM